MVAATVAAPSTGRPAASSTRTASVSVAPVVTTSSVITTTSPGRSPAARRSPARTPARRRTASAPDRFRCRSSLVRPAWSRTRRACRNQQRIATGRRSVRRQRRAAAWAIARPASRPRSRLARLDDGAGTRTSRVRVDFGEQDGQARGESAAERTGEGQRLAVLVPGDQRRTRVPRTDRRRPWSESRPGTGSVGPDAAATRPARRGSPGTASVRPGRSRRSGSRAAGRRRRPAPRRASGPAEAARSGLRSSAQCGDRAGGGQP